jgi:pimeloyl-ACP methyl ester carboxylesterase
MTVREGTVDSGGVKLHYLDWGGDGSPLVLLHATGFHSWLWDPIATQLTDRYRVVAYDQRGHGDSDGPDDAANGGYSFEQFADDLHAVITQLGLERPLAAGHSSGASTIAVHAARYPGVIMRGTLIEPILPAKNVWRDAPANANERAEQAKKRRAVWASTNEMFESYRSRAPFDTWREDVLRLYIEEGTRQRDDGQVELKCPPHLEAKYYEAVRDADFIPLLARAQVPLLLVWGQKSELQARMGFAISRALEHAVSFVMPGTTHFPPQERPDEVAELLARDSIFIPNLASASKS